MCQYVGYRLKYVNKPNLNEMCYWHMNEHKKETLGSFVSTNFVDLKVASQSLFLLIDFSQTANNALVQRTL